MEQINPKEVSFFKKILKPPYVYYLPLALLGLVFVFSLWALVFSDLTGSKLARGYIHLITKNKLVGSIITKRYCAFSGSYLLWGHFVIVSPKCYYCGCEEKNCTIQEYSEFTCSTPIEGQVDVGTEAKISPENNRVDNPATPVGALSPGLKESLPSDAQVDVNALQPESQPSPDVESIPTVPPEFNVGH